MEKSTIFGVVMTKKDREALKRLAEREHLSGGAVIRRLVWRELDQCKGESVKLEAAILSEEMSATGKKTN